MSISLKKGQKLSLSKEGKGLSRVIVGLGWDEARKRGFLFKKPESIDCDAIACLLTDNRLADRKDIVYFGNLKHESGTVIHEGDNLTGAGGKEEDDEHIVINLDSVPMKYNKIVIAVNIYQAYAKNQHFGMIENAFVRIIDTATNTEMCRFNLTDDYSGMTAMIFGEVYRGDDGYWQFNAIGQGTKDGNVNDLAKRFS